MLNVAHKKENRTEQAIKDYWKSMCKLVFWIQEEIRLIYDLIDARTKFTQNQTQFLRHCYQIAYNLALFCARNFKKYWSITSPWV